MSRNMPTEAGARSARLSLSVLLIVVMAAALAYAGSTLVAIGRAAQAPNGVQPAGLGDKDSEGYPTASATSTSATESTSTATATATQSTPTASATILSACVLGWSLVDRPTSDQLSDVSVIDGNQVWAVGTPNALRWVSGTWTVHNLATVLPQPKSISGSSSNDVWAAGDTKIAHWDGSGWAPVAYPSPTVVPYPSPYRDTPFFHLIRARSQNDVWVVGGYSGQYGSSCVTWKFCHPLVGHWNGVAWSVLASPKPAIGETPSGQDGATLVFQHYDGIGFISPNETWLVGSSDQWSGQVYDAFPMAVRCINTTCTLETPVYAGTLTSLISVSGTSTNDVWAVGSVGSSTLIERWNGLSWSVVSAPNVGKLTGVTAVAPNNVWAVGASAVLHYNGYFWQEATAPAGANAIDSRGPNNVWAVGAVVMHYPDMPIFSDVSPDNPFYRYIQELSCRGIISGYADGTFRPNNFVTRGQQAKIVSNAAGFNDPPGGQTFQDVAPGSTFYDFVQRLASRGYINGYPCGGPGEPCIPPGNLPYFRTNALVTRGQLAKIVSNAAGYSEPPGDQIFEDVAPDSTFYDFIERLAGRGHIGGYQCGGAGEPCNPPGNRPYFRPNGNATRGQTSKIVANTFLPGCCSGMAR